MIPSHAPFISNLTLGTPLAKHAPCPKPFLDATRLDSWRVASARSSRLSCSCCTHEATCACAISNALLVASTRVAHVLMDVLRCQQQGNHQRAQLHASPNVSTCLTLTGIYRHTTPYVVPSPASGIIKVTVPQQIAMYPVLIMVTHHVLILPSYCTILLDCSYVSCLSLSMYHNVPCRYIANIY